MIYPTPLLPRITDHVAIDFEAYHDKEVSIKTLGAWKYLQHPKCDIFLVSVYDGKKLFVGHPKSFNWGSIRNRHWVSHNRSFDFEVHARLIELEVVPDVHPSLWDCSADLATWRKSRRNLKDACKNLLKRETSKEVRALMKGLMPEDMMQLVLAENGKLYRVDQFLPNVQADILTIRPDGFDGTFWGDVQRYAGEDAVNCWDLFAQEAPYWPERERRISRMSGRQGSRGIQMDVPGLNVDLEVLEYACAYAKAQLPWMYNEEGKLKEDEEGVMSIPELRKAIADAGYTPPKTTNEDSASCRKFEAENPECKLIKYVRDFRKCNILRRRYQHVLARIKPDGRFPFAWSYGGTPHTLRWTGGSDAKKGGTGETGFNVQNMSKEPLYIAESGEVVDEETAAYWTVDFRSRCVVAKGKKWVCADAAQIEARITLWIAGEYERLLTIAAGMSIYEEHARNAGWNKPGDLKKDYPKEYFLFKNRVLALGFQCGWKKFFKRCRELGFEITEDEAKKQVKDFRAKERKVRNTWFSLQNEIEGACSRNRSRDKGLLKTPHENFEIELPHGLDSIMYFLPFYRTQKAMRKEQEELKGKKADASQRTKHRSDLAVDDEEDTAEDKNFKEWKDNLQQAWARTQAGGRIDYFYGGKLLENWAQRIARDVFCEMLLNCEDHGGMDGMFSVHDEINLEVDEDIPDSEIQAVLERMPDWCEGLPVSVDVQHGEFYFK